MTSPGKARGRNGVTSRLHGSPFLREIAEWHSTKRSGHEESRDSLAERNAAAVDLLSTGSTARALTTLHEIAATCTTVLGADDVDTLVARGNVAVLHAVLEQWDEALPLLTTNLAARDRVLGDEHPATLAARDALAAAHRLGGEPAEAAALSARVAAQRTRVLGPTHRDTLTSRLGHGLACFELGDVPAATEYLAAALHDAERALGAADPMTAVLREQLARCQAEAGHREEAAATRRVPEPRTTSRGWAAISSTGYGAPAPGY